jgi:Ni/Co efflux regulator RcnB
MLKTISAALLAMSVIAAPALAGQTGKTFGHTAPVIKSEQLPSKVRNANAKMGRDHHKHYRHHRHHKHMGLLKVKSPKHVSNHIRGKVAIKHVAPAKRG